MQPFPCREAHSDDGGMQPKSWALRQVRVRPLLAACLVASTLAACSTPASPSASSKPNAGSVFLPTYRPMDGVPAAEIRGRLVEEDGCIWIDRPEGRALPLWPPGSTFEMDGDTLAVVNSDGTRAVVGADVVGGGGEYGGPGHYEVVVDAIGRQVPTVCRGGDHYLLVYEVHVAGQ